jgi:hypothetical protein
MQHRARGQELVDHRRVLGGPVVLHEHRAGGDRPSGHGVLVLHRGRNAFERVGFAAHPAHLRCARRGERLVEIGVGEAVDARIDPLGPRDLRLEHLDRRDLAGGVERKQFGRRKVAQVVACLGERAPDGTRSGERGGTQALEERAPPKPTLRETVRHASAPMLQRGTDPDGRWRVVDPSGVPMQPVSPCLADELGRSTQTSCHRPA